MNKIKALKLTSVTFVIVVLLMVMGCSADEGQTTPAPNESPNGPDQSESVAPSEPVTLGFYTNSANYEEEFTEEVVNPIKEVHPHIDFKFYSATGGSEIGDLVVAGEVPDLYYQGTSALTGRIIPSGLEYDISPLVKQFNLDLSRIDESYMKIIQNITAGDELYGLPVYAYSPVLYYNKDIFSQFGIDVPEDGMTWDEAYELGREVARFEDGIQYRAMSMNYPYFMDNNEFGLTYVSATENKAVVDTDDWRKLLSNYARFYLLTSNIDYGDFGRIAEVDDFIKDRVSAMHLDVNAAAADFPDELNWDMVSVPYHEGAERIGPQVNPRYYYLMVTSEHKEEAFKVMEFVLSDEMQMRFSRLGKMPVVKGEQFEKVFGEDDPKLKGKNTGALFYNTPVDPPEPRQDGLVTINPNNARNKAFRDLVNDRADINSIMREFQEALEQEILVEMKSQ